MNATLSLLSALLRETLRDPKAAMHRVLSLPIPRPALWQAFALVVILGMLLTYVSDLLLPAPENPMLLVFRNTPIGTVAMALGLTLAMVIALHRAGRAFGGTGDFEGALRVVTWLQAVMFVFNAVQLLLLIVLPPLGVLMGVVNLGLTLWLLTNFVATLHGFRSLLPAFLLIIVTAMALGFAFYFVLALAGVLVLPEVADV